MIQGTGSSVGKSLIVAGLCRLYKKKGFKVFPFKPQNMSNNAAATIDGGEIGRAQALQALASGIDPITELNPILLKPESKNKSQLIVNGKYRQTISGKGYQTIKQSLLTNVIESYKKITETADLIIIEGAGSPAEINLRDGDIANMGFSTKLNIPTILVGDIDRGGVIASIVGTHAVLNTADKDNIVAFIVNKFRGDPELFKDGITEVVNRTGWPFLGLIPYFELAKFLPAEDSLDLERIIYEKNQKPKKTIKITIPVLGKISNFDDIDSLRMQSFIEINMISSGDVVPDDTDIVLLLGSKSTINDLIELKKNGWDIDIKAHARKNKIVIGLCGGYQMLGKIIDDPFGAEGSIRKIDGLGLLDVITVLEKEKKVKKLIATHLFDNKTIEGYEIHLGKTSGLDCDRPMFKFDQKMEGAISSNYKIYGTYLHGFFNNKGACEWLLNLCNQSNYKNDIVDYNIKVNEILDSLAEHLEKHLDWKKILEISENYARNKH